MSKYKSDDVDLLLPSFAKLVKDVLAELTNKGYEPIPFDTLRTPEEAARNAAKGTGTANSMHIYGCACDIICGKHGWDCQKEGCHFYAELQQIVESRNLISGARFSRRDYPHFQMCTIAEQNKVRSITNWSARDKFCHDSWLARKK
jgi:hypothetical protein